MFRQAEHTLFADSQSAQMFATNAKYGFFLGFKIRKTFYGRVVCEVQRRLWRFDGKNNRIMPLLTELAH